MTRNVVNLDALLVREDLSAPAEAAADIEGLKITDLKPGLVYSWLRKPDFQRETANWTPDQVAGLIETFANGNIIPAIILWQNGQRVYIVDGAHRLSALIAWVHDDYGAGPLSLKVYEARIPEQQRAMHKATRELVVNSIGSYAEHEQAAQSQKSDDAALLSRASKLGFKNIDVQWIRNANVEQARKAFFRINQGGTEIDPTETRILRAQNSSLAIASRAIARGGTGHNYWKKFNPPMREEIEYLGEEIHRLLFAPTFNTPVKTLDVPLGGFGYGAHVLPFAFDLVTISNNLSVADSTNKKRKIVDELPDDPDGKETVAYLNRTKKRIQLLLSNDPSSFGLHPALYFYTAGGAFQSAALFNVLSWVLELDEKKQSGEFLKVRGSFERLILDHPVLIKPATHKLGSGGRTRRRMVLLYERIFKLLTAGVSHEEAWKKIILEADFKFLASDDHEQKQEGQKGSAGRRFESKAKSAGFFEQAFPSAPKCSLCGGLLHVNGMVADHKDEKSRGGSSASANARMVHPVCNSNRGSMA